MSTDSHCAKSMFLVIQKKLGLLKSNGGIVDRYWSWSTTDSWSKRIFQSILVRTAPARSVMRSQCIFFQQDNLPRHCTAFSPKMSVTAPDCEGEPIHTGPLKLVWLNSLCPASLYVRALPKWCCCCVDCVHRSPLATIRIATV